MKHMKHMKKALVLAMAMVASMLFGTAVFAADVEIGHAPNKDGASAYTLEIGKEYFTSLSGAPGYVSFVTPVQEGYVTVRCKNINIGNNQYFAVKTQSDEILTDNTWVSNGNSVDWEYKSETVDKKNGAKLEPNTRYYIVLGENQPSGNVKFSVTFVADANANSKAEAEEIALNTEYTRSMDAWNLTDVDYFRFQAKTTGRHRLTINNAGSSYLKYELHKWNSDELVKNISNRDISESWLSGDDTHTVDANLEAGEWYYLCVWHNKIGNYTFSISNQQVTSIAIPSTVTLDSYQEFELNAAVAPDMAYNKKLEYVSSNTDVASVNDSGKIKAYDCGFATITAKATDGSGVEASCLVIVRPGQSDKPYVEKNSTNSIQLKWNTISGAKGYVISYKTSKAKKWKTVKTTKNTVTVKKLNSATAYLFKVKAYVDVNGTVVYGKDCESVRTCTMPEKTKIIKLKRVSSKRYGYGGTTYRVKITWKKVKGAGSYKLYYRLPGSQYKNYYGTYTSNSAVFQRSYSRGSSATKNMIFYVTPVKTDVGKKYEGKYSDGKRYKMH